MTTQQTRSRVYDPAFFAGLSDGATESARLVVPLVTMLVRPASVLDVGCGGGQWLSEWISLGVTDVLGMDGQYLSPEALHFDPGKFIPTDLQQPFWLGRKFDLVECLEVAEHLDARFADQFVASLTRHGDLVLFSAAIPGQGGVHHVNEQWPSYWIEKFAQAGFKPYDVIRPLIWDDARVQLWYRQNILLFAKNRTFDSQATAAGFNVVHPELWKQRTDFLQRPRFVLRAAPAALRSALKSKILLHRSS